MEQELITLDSCGDRSDKAKRELSELLPQGMDVVRRRGEWFLAIRDARYQTTLNAYRDGMVVVEPFGRALLRYPNTARRMVECPHCREVQAPHRMDVNDGLGGTVSVVPVSGMFANCRYCREEFRQE